MWRSCWRRRGKSSSGCSAGEGFPMWWRVELDSTGAILTCDFVPDKGRNGGHVIFVEASTKPLACSAAKAWHQRKLARVAVNLRGMRDKRRADGVCTRCSAPMAPERMGKTRCHACVDDQRAGRREQKSAGRHRKVLSAEEIRENARICQRRINRRRCERTWQSLLDQFDRLGSNAFRAWLVAEIAQRLDVAEQAQPIAAE